MDRILGSTTAPSSFRVTVCRTLAILPPSCGIFPVVFAVRVYVTHYVYFIVGTVSVTPVADALVYINGKAIADSTNLRTGSRVILGKNYVFRFNHPQQAAKERLEGMAKSISSDVMSK